MSLARLLNQPLTIQKRGGTVTNVYGDTELGSVGAPVAVKGYLVQSSSLENMDDRDMVVSRWTAYLPAGTDIGHLDYINFQSQKFQVDGIPEFAYNPRTEAISHIVCQLVVVVG